MKKILFTVLLVAVVLFSFALPVSAADLADGSKVFGANCAFCHLNGRNLINPAKTLQKADLEKYEMASLAAIQNQIRNGKNAMPAFKGRLNDAQFQVGVAAFQNEVYELSVEAFTQAIQQQPNFAAGYHNCCLAYLSLSEHEQAIADCTQGLQLDPMHTESYLNRGLAYYRLGEFQNAVKDYDQLLQLKPDDYQAYYNRGLAQVALGAMASAIEDYNQSIQYNPVSLAAQQAEIFNDRGVVYLQLEETQKAIADFTQLIRLNTEDARAYFNRACACHREGNLLAALQDFDQVLALAPDHAQTYFNRGMIHHQMGNTVAAIADLQRAAHCFQEQGATIAYHSTVVL